MAKLEELRGEILGCMGKGRVTNAIWAAKQTYRPIAFFTDQKTIPKPTTHKTISRLFDY